jgi:hypothetical protein
MPQWKVKLEADDSTLGQLAGKCDSPKAKVIRDGVDWFLESTDFDMMMDPVEVKNKAVEIVGAIANGGSINLGPVYRLHYDNSKTVYR